MIAGGTPTAADRPPWWSPSIPTGRRPGRCSPIRCTRRAPDRLRIEHFAAITAPTVFTQAPPTRSAPSRNCVGRGTRRGAHRDRRDHRRPARPGLQDPGRAQDACRRGDSDALTCSGTVETWPSISSTQSSSGRIRWNQGGDPAQAAGFRRFRASRARGRLGGTWYVNHRGWRWMCPPPATVPSGPTPNGRDCSPPARRSNGTPTTSPTKLRRAPPSGSTRRSRGAVGTGRRRVAGRRYYSGETLTARYLITATGSCPNR